MADRPGGKRFAAGATLFDECGMPCLDMGGPKPCQHSTTKVRDNLVSDKLPVAFGYTQEALAASQYVRALVKLLKPTLDEIA